MRRRIHLSIVTRSSPSGETIAYHAMMYGWLVGGLPERADGRPFARLVAEEIAESLGLDGLYDTPRGWRLDRRQDEPAGHAPGVLARIRDVCERPVTGTGLCRPHRLRGRRGVLVVTGAAGHGTTVEAEGIDASSDTPARFAFGYRLGGPESNVGPRESAFGHAGYGGAYGFANPDYGLAVGLAKNLLTMNAPCEGASLAILHHVRQNLRIPD